ncbi:RIC1-domain-containing protein [Jimgerdemannia flammicorona]|uniref:RIC1-domain-containing protein n=1 Tax=Jimgerdemannia flammicorona TaxID=994334 RepID=A0A433QVW7_9FUNG|nr:RIC1-domain-containing protein [Jimgerdemannia flammicorona]
MKLSPGTSAPASSTSPTTDWAGYCFHGAVPEQSVNGMTLDEAQKNEKGTNKEGVEWNEYHHATCVAVNTRGDVFVYSAHNYTSAPTLSHTLSLRKHNPSFSRLLEPNRVTSLAWTSDGYALAVGGEHLGISVWSVYGALLVASVRGLEEHWWEGATVATPTTEMLSPTMASGEGSAVLMSGLTPKVMGTISPMVDDGFPAHIPQLINSSPWFCILDGTVLALTSKTKHIHRFIFAWRGQLSEFWGPGNHDLYVLTPPPPLGGYRKKSNGSKRDDDDAGDTDRPSNNNPLLFCLPFAKSAVTVLHSPENTKRGFLLLESSMLLYSGGEHNDITAINPDAIVWSHIQYPAIYITEHWPIRYATINSDGRYVAIAGRRGLAHYNMSSGRWKLFGNQQHEREFVVRGGMAWYKHVLIAACQDVSTKSQEIRLYSRETNLDNMYMLYSTSLHNSQSTTLHLAISGSYLTVYCSDNVIYVYLIERPTLDTYKLELLREISLVGIVNQTGRVRGMSMLNATGIAGTSQIKLPCHPNYYGRIHPNNGTFVHPFGSGRLSTLDELLVANIVLLVDGKLVLLRSHVSDDYNPEMPDTHFDLYILADMVECYWIGNKVVGNLESSIWAVDGQGIKIFTNLFDADAFNVDSTFIIEEDSAIEPLSSSDMDRLRSETSSLMSLPTSPPPRWKVLDLSMASEYALHVRLDFYPLSIMLDKGIIMGVEQSISIRTSLDFAIFKIHTKASNLESPCTLHIERYGIHAKTWSKFIDTLVPAPSTDIFADLDQEAVTFGRAYEKFVYFGHALEILLHRVLEDEADRALGTSEDFITVTQTMPYSLGAILPSVVKFLDHFSHALDVIVGCARKTEVALWEYLFSIVGNPKDLFEMCMAEDRLKTATSYLIILHTLQPLAVGGKDTVRLLQKALDAENFEVTLHTTRLHVIKRNFTPSNYLLTIIFDTFLLINQLCKELVRFLNSIDSTGQTLQDAVAIIQARENGPLSPTKTDAQMERVVERMATLGV